MCDRFHKTPEQIERCDMARILRMVGLVGVYDALKKLQRGEVLTPDENILCGELLALDLEHQKKGIS